MDTGSSSETLKGVEIGEVKERYVPKVWHRLALLALIYVTAGYLDHVPGPGALFDVVVAAAAAYTVVIRLLAKKLTLRPWAVLTVDLSLALAMCTMTGGVTSPVKYFGLAYFYLLSPYIASRRMKAFLLAYSVSVTLLVLDPFMSAGGMPLRDAARISLLNLFVLNGAGWPSVLLAEYIQRIRALQRDTSLTFHSLNSALHLRTQNLQAALDALTQAHEKLKQADENKTRLLSNVSHELRTPLSSVRSFTEILMSYEDLDRDTEKEFLGIIHGEAKRLNLLINDILDVVRLESGKVDIHPVRVDMAEVIRGAVRTLMPMADEKGLGLKFVEPDGWTPWVKGDKNQLTQVLVNLINNAVKFTPSGGITITVEHEGCDIAVSVSDTGEGVYPEEREKIFEEFFRVADNVGGRPTGSGLGLTISRKIVELHGGRIWVEGELGKGSDFRFTVPVDVEEFMPANGRPPEKPAAGRPRREKATVLVVEENSTIRQLLRKRIEDLGYVTLGAESGKSALKLATEWEPDCVVSCMHRFADRDVNLYTGMRSHPKTVSSPVIITSLLNHPSRGLQVGVNGFVRRPIDRYSLMKVVDDCLRHTRGTLLVISPDRLEARTIQLILGNGGYDVTLADESTWQDASRRRQPSAVILDGTLQERTRHELLSAIRASNNTARVPVILITEAPVDDGKVMAAALGDRPFEHGGETLGPVREMLRAAVG